MIPIPVDYEILRLIWWVLLGVLLIGIAVMDGFDMGVAFLNPILGKTDAENRVMINTIAPVWDGNQVWLITGGGAIFAAWPAVYATAFSGFYIAMFLVLVSLILRPVSLEYRNKFEGKARKAWDWALFTSGLIPPLVFGVAFGNLFLGVPFQFDEFKQPHYVDGFLMSFIHLLMPFALLTGLVSVAMHAGHGAAYLAAKTTGPVQEKAKKTIPIAYGIWLVLFIIGGIWVGKIGGFTITSQIDPNGLSDPTTKIVIAEKGVWLRNYFAHPILFVVPLLAIISSVLTIFLSKIGRPVTAFVTSGLTIAMTITTAAVALFPFLMTSKLNPSHSLTVFDASSSPMTLWIMTIVAIIFVPIVLSYTAWAYSIVREAINEKYIHENSNELY